MATLKLISQNVGFSFSNSEPKIATITGQLPSSVSASPIVFQTGNPTIFNNFVPGQVTYTYITSSEADSSAIEAAVTIIPMSTECVEW